MSIEKLKLYRNEYNGDKENWNVIMSDFMDEVIITFEEQIKQLAQKEDKIDVNNIKEVKRLNG